VIGGIVLAGGSGRRMGGMDKAALRVGGVALLDRVLGAARPVCDRLAVVGPVRPTSVAGATFVTEDPPGGGPVPGVAAGVVAVEECTVVLVLATDLPLLTAAHLQSLLIALDDHRADAAAAADVHGPNPLLAAYRAPVLRAALAGLGPGSAAGLLLPARTVTVDVGPGALNVNRPEDLAAAERALAPAPAHDQ
jgi:molybdopterin-guanine dinucleotide biosynthesis protein A